MTSLINQAIPYLVLLSHATLVALLLAILFRNSFGKEVVRFTGKYALHLGLLLSLGALVGSLFYSDAIGFEACVLCWWQRIFLYPMVVLFGVALWRKDRSVFSYVVPLALLTVAVGGYHELANLFGVSFLACTAEGGGCDRVFVRAFGYITIPVMSLTIAFGALLLAWVNRLYKKNESRSRK